MRRLAFPALIVVAALLALLTARPYAGSWNDGSRLAAIESLVDRGTFQIDDSIYVHTESASFPPFTPGDEFLAKHGTKDKMFIDGHYYSDKSPVPGVLMAGVYRILRSCGFPSAHDRPDWFARVMAWLFTGLPYVLAVFCIGRIARHVGLQPPWNIVLTATFAFGSLALPYAQSVNNHILLLAVAAGVCDAMLRPTTAADGLPIHRTWRRAAWLGTLAGFGYTIDLGAGPLLVAVVGAWLLWQRSGVIAYVLGALPWIAVHHVLNYSISGAIGPGNANPEHFVWPGSPFNADNMTGSWHHPSMLKAVEYSLDLLFGKKGFFLHSLPLVQVLFGTYWLFRYRTAERAVLVALVAWCVGTWLLYAATSRNLSGVCLSIRWFVPLVVPGYVALMVLVRDYPRSRWPLVPLLIGALILNSELVARGPWSGRVPLFLWPVVGLSLLVWAALWVHAIRRWLQTAVSKQ